MATIPMIDGTKESDLVHPAGSERQMFTNLNPGYGGSNRFELTSYVDRRGRLEIEHVLRGGAALQEQEDDAFRLPGSQPERGPSLLGSIEGGRIDTQAARCEAQTAQEGRSAGLQRFPPGQTITETARRAEYGKHVRYSPQKENRWLLDRADNTWGNHIDYSGRSTILRKMAPSSPTA